MTGCAKIELREGHAQNKQYASSENTDKEHRWHGTPSDVFQFGATVWECMGFGLMHKFTTYFDINTDTGTTGLTGTDIDQQTRPKRGTYLPAMFGIKSLRDAIITADGADLGGVCRHRVFCVSVFVCLCIPSPPFLSVSIYLSACRPFLTLCVPSLG